MSDTSERKMRETIHGIHARQISRMTNMTYDACVTKADTKIERMREENNRRLADAKTTLFN